MMALMVKPVIAIALLLTTATLAGCGDNSQPAPTSPEVNADDIVTAPGLGPQYRANMHEAGVTNPWEQIESVSVILEDPDKPAEVSYRDYIETEAGKAANNIFRVYLPDVDIGDLNASSIDVNIQAAALPDGISAVTTMEWHGADPARQSKTVVRIEVGDEVLPGEYSLAFRVEIDGKYYGQVPCTIKVV